MGWKFLGYRQWIEHHGHVTSIARLFERERETVVIQEKTKVTALFAYTLGKRLL